MLFNYIINLFKSQKIFGILLFFYLFFIFFPVRRTFFTEHAYLLGKYSDFTSFSLYISDILLLLLALIILIQDNSLFKVKNYFLSNFFKISTLLGIFVFSLILNLFFHGKTFSGLNIYFFVKLVEIIIVAYGTIGLMFSQKFTSPTFHDKLLQIFALFTSFQAILAIIQFTKQSSIGLYRLGESHLGKDIVGASKIIIEGERYVRGYGTFPHPNILSVFLVTGTLIYAYLFYKSQKKQSFLYALALFINILGITVAFSRAGYLGLAFGLTIYFGFLLVYYFKKKIANLKNILLSAVTILFLIFISFLIFKPFLIGRLTISDAATTERGEYNRIALKMIKANPFLGTGVGDSVLHMQQYAGRYLQLWERQPIHNYFLLSGAELGIPAALILIYIFTSHTKILMHNIKLAFSEYNVLFISILSTFLLLMLFDHYFYTLQQTQMLLWLTLGIIAGQNKKHPS